MTLEIQQDQSLARFNTLRLDVAAEQFAIARSEVEISEALGIATERGWPVTILGGGSNVVLRNDIKGLVLVNAVPGILFDGDVVEAGAGESWHQLVLASIEQGLSGLENLALIPGSVGAAPMQNIGAYGAELASVFESLCAIDRDSLSSVLMTAADCEFGYRDSIFKREARDRYVITRVRLRLSHHFNANLAYDELEAAVRNEPSLNALVVSEAVCRIRKRKLPDPEVIGNVGSFFKNPVLTDSDFERLYKDFPSIHHWRGQGGVKLAAGWLIDQCGLKGHRVGGAAVSKNHALVIVNDNDATGEDVMRLAGLVSEEVSNRFDVSLEIEPVVY